MADVNFAGTREQLQARLALLPAALVGQVPGMIADARALAKALGVELLSCVKEAYVEKARGGTGPDGIRWAPLSPRTIAYGRRHKGLRAKKTRAARKGRAGRPLLTDAQDGQWRAVYAACLRKGDDRPTAAAKAWGVVKRAGGKTILGQYGSAQVEIGRDTGRLLASLSPGNPSNVLDAKAGGVLVGSGVEYARWFHLKRPLYPHSGELPAAWLARLGAVLEAAMPAFVKKLLERA